MVLKEKLLIPVTLIFSIEIRYYFMHLNSFLFLLKFEGQDFAQFNKNIHILCRQSFIQTFAVKYIALSYV